MLKNLISMTNRFYEDQALIFMTFGGFGRYVLYILLQEFRRLGIPEEKINFLAFDTEKPHRDRLNLELESEYFYHLEEFDGETYIKNTENKDLKAAVSQIPITLLRDIEGGCKGVPAVGFVAFHKYDDLEITKEALRLIDDVRSKNPGKKVKLIVISGMGGSVSNGMTTPFLYRIKDRLREKKIRVEVFLTTSEGYLGLQNILEESIERNCVANAMLWEYAMAGRNGLTYPAKDGVRDRKMFSGKIAHRIYIFSGGSSETSLKYQAIAPTIANCISTLEMTKVGSYLDGDRVNYSAHILEREWMGKNGNTHPTGLLTMNAGGLKGDCIPQIFHLHIVKRFIDNILNLCSEKDEDSIKGLAISTFLENNLNEDDILDLFKIDIPLLTRNTINEAHVSEENVYRFLQDQVSETLEVAKKEFEEKKKHENVTKFIDRVKNNFSQKGDELTVSPGRYLNGGLLFYEKLSSLLKEKVTIITEGISKIEEELFEGSNQKRLNSLLDKLEAVSGKKNAVELVVTFGKSPTISVINQIIDTVSKIQQQKLEKYNYLLLQHIYNAIFTFCQNRQDILRSSIFKYGKLSSKISREEEIIIRTTRSAFSYNESKFSKLAEHLMEELYSKIDTIPTQEVIRKLGGLIHRSEPGGEKEHLEKLLNIIRPDIAQLSQVAGDLFCNDEKVYDYIKTMLAQFFLTLKLDRDRFPTLETSQSSFVICTRSFYEKYKDDLFNGYSHIEDENPFNVIVTRHEEGFPFIAMSYFYRINEQFKEIKLHNKSSLGHIMAVLDEKLPLLDA